MSAPRPLAASAGTTFVVHCVSTAIAALPAYLAAAALDRIGGALPGGAAELTAPGGAYLVEAIDLLAAEHLYALTVALGAALALTLLVSPWLHMAWLAAIDTPTSAARALHAGLRRYLPCVGARLVLATAGAAALLALLALSAIAREAAGALLDVRSADLLVLASLLPSGLLLVVFGCLWDLVHASLAREGRGVLAALRDGVRALRPRALTTYLALGALGLGLLLAAHLTGVALPTDDAAWVVGGFALAQLLLLGRAFVRAAWLAAALRHTARRAPTHDRPRATRARGRCASAGASPQTWIWMPSASRSRK